MTTHSLIPINCLEDSGWRAGKCSADRDGALVIEVSRDHEVGPCPECGAKAANNGFRTRELWGAPWEREPEVTIPIRLTLQIQEYCCIGTPVHYWAQPIDDVPRGRVTNELRVYIQEHAFRTPFLTLEKWTGIGDKTVRKYFLEYIADLDRHRVLETPEHMAIHRRGSVGACFLVLVNLLEDTVIEVLENDKPETLRKFLSSNFKLHEIETVCIDANEAYREVVKSLMPKAQVVLPIAILREVANGAFRKLLSKLGRGLSVRQRKSIERVALDVESEGIRELLQLLKSSRLKDSPIQAAGTLWFHFSLIWEATNHATAMMQARKWRKTVGQFEDDLDELIDLMGWDEDELYTEYNFSAEMVDYLKNTWSDLQEIIEAGRGYDHPVLRGKMLYYKETLVSAVPDDAEQRVVGLILDEPVIAKIKRFPIRGASISGLLDNVREGYF